MMSSTLSATFDGVVLRPDEPLELPANSRVLITLEAEPPALGRPSFLNTARSLELDGPPDWSARLEDYLYGDRDEHE